jgi:hypothetical protein
VTRQWGAGNMPKVEYNQEYAAAYDAMTLVAAAQGGVAIEMPGMPAELRSQTVRTLKLAQ